MYSWGIPFFSVVKTTDSVVFVLDKKLQIFAEKTTEKNILDHLERTMLNLDNIIYLGILILKLLFTTR